MNLVYAEVVELFSENGLQMGRIRVSGALQKIPLELLTGVQCGDKVLVCDGVAISRVEDRTNEEGRLKGS